MRTALFQKEILNWKLQKMTFMVMIYLKSLRNLLLKEIKLTKNNNISKINF